LIKSDSKDIYTVTKTFYFTKNMMSVYIFNSLNVSWCPHITLSSTTVFNITNNHQVSILDTRY